MTPVISFSSYLVQPVALPGINIFKERKRGKKIIYVWLLIAGYSYSYVDVFQDFQLVLKAQVLLYINIA